MANNSRLNADQVSVLMTEGTFRGVRMLLEQKKLTDDEARAVLARSYEALLLEVEEAQKELHHIQSALTRLENICRQGRQNKNPGAGEHLHQQMGDNVVNLDNWIVSLMETDLTITGMLNPSLTRNKINQFGVAMNELMNKRAVAKNPVLDDPQLFSGYVNW